jgi:signal transduction histidine kinase
MTLEDPDRRSSSRSRSNSRSRSRGKQAPPDTQGEPGAGDRLARLGGRAGGVAHDFNNLLTVIQGCIEQAISMLAADSPIRRELADAKAASQQGAKLIAELLAREPPHAPEPLDVTRVLVDASGLLARVVGNGVELGVATGQQRLWRVRATAAEIWQLLFNLTLNARDAMPHGGRLLVETRNEVLERPDAGCWPPLARGQYLVLRVADTGLGMDEATRQRMFDPFFTTKLDKGTGLGLATVAQVVIERRGGLRVDSRPGSGTTIDVYLPRANGDGDDRGRKPTRSY